MLKITAVCNAGIYLEQDNYGLLIDGICSDYDVFSGTSNALFQQIIEKEACFASLRAAMFTHLHPDHCDIARTDLMLKLQPGCEFWLPDEKMPQSGCVRMGPFFVYYYEVPHIPGSIPVTRHYVFLIRAGRQNIYLAADAETSVPVHQRILHNHRVDYMFINPTHFAADTLRSYLSGFLPKRIFVYHLPEESRDSIGYMRKAQRILRSSMGTIPPTQLINRYPTALL